MSVTIRNAASTASSDKTSTSITLGLPPNVVAGDVVFVLVSCTSTSTAFTQTAGPSLTLVGSQQTSSNMRSAVFRRTIVDGDAGQNVTIGTGSAQGRRSISVIAVGGADAANVVVAARKMGGSGPDVATSSEVAASAGLALGLHAVADSDAAWGSNGMSWTGLNGSQSTAIASSGSTGNNVAALVQSRTVTAGQTTNLTGKISVWSADRHAYHVLVPAQAATVTPLSASSVKLNAFGGQPLDLAASTSGGQGTVTWEAVWRHVSGPAAVHIGSNADGSGLVVGPVTGGVMVLERTATDGAAQTATARCEVTVSPQTHVQWGVSPVATGRTASNASTDAATVVSGVWDTTGSALSGTAAQDYVSASAMPSTAATDGARIVWRGEHTGTVSLQIIDAAGNAIPAQTVTVAGVEHKVLTVPAADIARMTTMAAGWRLREVMT